MDKIQAAAEILKRRQARSNLIAFAQYCNKEYLEAEHLKNIATVLEQVEQGIIKRVIISMPPRFGKSLLSSVMFPAWYLGRNPTKRIVVTGYSESIASNHSRLCRELFYKQEFGHLFPGLHEKNTELELKKSAKEWHTKAGGSYYAVGVGGGLTGRGFNIGIIDDYLKDRADADSEIARSRVLEWYRSTFYTRQEPDAAIIIISTRWHLQDLIGSLILEEKNDGEKWEIIKFPAIIENDGIKKSLWGDRYSLETLENIKKAVGVNEWNALYMQEPLLKFGSRFNTSLVKIHNDIKEFPKKIYSRAWDLASSSKERSKDDPDYTVGVLGCVTTENNLKQIWISDVVRIRENAPKRNEIIINTSKKDGNSRVYVEAFGAYKDAYNELRNILRGISIVNPSRLSGDKEVKAAPLEPVFEAGNVHLLRGSWNNDFLSEFQNFPMAAHDDIVDATAILFSEETKSRAAFAIR